MHPQTKASSPYASQNPASSKPQTPGYKAVLIADVAYGHLKNIQFCKSSARLPLPVRFDLKDIATAFVEEAMELPDFQERVLKRALVNVTALLTASTTKE